MSVDMFFKIDGAKGESSDAVHKDAIDVLSWSWGMTQPGSAHKAKGAGSGRAAVQDLSFTKYVDAATPNLFKMCAAGTAIPKAVLVVRKAGSTPLEYLKITLEDGMVAGVSTGGSGGEDRLTETVALNFAKFKVEYKPQKADGSGAAAIEMGWHIAENKAC